MGESEHRQIVRDSLFVLAQMRLNGSAQEHRVRVRNLSAGGLMAEGSVGVVPGLPLEIEVRNIGWVAGTVAWVHDTRFGIAFLNDIDPQVARATTAPNEATDRMMRRPMGSRVHAAPDPRSIRKI